MDVHQRVRVEAAVCVSEDAQLAGCEAAGLRQAGNWYVYDRC